jgi:hypothetical protein
MNGEHKNKGVNMKKSIARTHKNVLAKIKATATEMVCHCLENSFRGSVVLEPAKVIEYWENFPSKRPSLSHDGEGSFKLRFHSNEWYTFKATI